MNARLENLSSTTDQGVARVVRVMSWVLRCSVALQCVGYARWMLDPDRGEGELFALLWGAPQFGGLGWTEAGALAAQRAVGWGYIVAAIVTLVRPTVFVLAPVAVMQGILAFAGWWMAIELFPEWTFPSQALRIGGPIALCLIDPWPATRMIPANRVRAAECVLRWATALTFLGHGACAIRQSPAFQNLIAHSAHRLFDWSPSQVFLERTTLVIGIVDVIVAALIVTTRWKSVAWWMAFWGLVTACSRMTYYGFDAGWHQTLLRATHAGAPLALAVYWQWGREFPHKTAIAPSNDVSAAEVTQNE